MLNKVNVGGLEYVVKVDDETAKKLNSEQNWGYVDYHNVEIQILNNAADQRQNASLCHEIVHAMLSQAGLQQINTEEVVAPLGNQLFQLLKYNDFGFMLRKDITAPYTYAATRDMRLKELEDSLDDIINKLIDIRDGSALNGDHVTHKQLSALIVQIKTSLGGK